MSPGEPSAGPIARDPTLKDLRFVLQALAAEAVEYALIGGMALNVHGYMRRTGDIDLLVRTTPENNARWVRALSRLPDGGSREAIGELDPFPRDAETGQLGVIRILDEYVVDVLPVACGITYDEVESDVIVAELDDGTPVRVLSLPALLRTKQTLRPKDAADRLAIEAMIRAEKREREAS